MYFLDCVLILSSQLSSCRLTYSIHYNAYIVPTKVSSDLSLLVFFPVASGSPVCDVLGIE